MKQIGSRNSHGQATVKVVAEIEPSLKRAFDLAANKNGQTKRAALEQAMRAYVREGSKGDDDDSGRGTDTRNARRNLDDASNGL